MKKEYIVVEWVPIQSTLVALELVPSFANGVKGESITLFVGIQAKLLIVDDVVINGDLFFFVSIYFFRKIVVRGTLGKKVAPKCRGINFSFFLSIFVSDSFNLS